jgi:protocatechuate 3,4-dioxygenase beta subunit
MKFSMKITFLLVTTITLILLASCTAIGLPTITNQSVENTQVNLDSGIAQPTDLSKPEDIATKITEEPEKELNATIPPPSPVQAQIPCSGELTSPNQEGPFYKSGSPKRESLIEEGMTGTPILIQGRIFNQDCRSLSGVKVDFWLADVNIEYDNVGYTLRGHQFSDVEGNYSIESIKPTPYTGRPSHIHVKLFAPDGRELLTTQMYFPGSESSADVLNSPDLLVTYLEPDPTGRQQVLFNFILQD